MSTPPTQAVQEFGQSIWFDYIERKMIFSGQLHRMIEQEGLRGVTSNPSIFEKSMGSSRDYLPSLRQVVLAGASAKETYEHLAIEDIQWACDVFRGVYDETEGADGFVSLEVSPHLADDTLSTIEEAHRLWDAVGRPNLMVKVPGTEAGLPAVEQLLTDGINVNITLLFSVERYRRVLEAYLVALERRRAEQLPIDRIASVASFFVSRIDSKVDTALETAAVEDDVRSSLQGKVAIANAKRAYAHFLDVKDSDRYRSLVAHGARPQRLLWASTSTKNPSYPDTLYVDALVGAETVNTVPAPTYAAFNEHGRVSASLAAEPDEAEDVLRRLATTPVRLDSVTEELEREGVRLFAEAYDRLMQAVERRRKEVLGPSIARLSAELTSHAEAVDRRLAALADERFPSRLWDRDGTLFGTDAESHAHAAHFMGWLDVVDEMEVELEAFEDLQDDLVEEGLASVVLMGMGGSSLAPDVWRRTFGQLDGHPELLVLDSTSPTQVLELEKEVDLEETAFITASKSGTTTEPRAFDRYFYGRLASVLSDTDSELEAGDRFMAITDPGSRLELEAFERDYRAIFNGDPEVGGRFSALSPFGLVPLACMGVDIADFLNRTRRMVGSCAADIPPPENEGIRLGAILGELALAGRDKVTLITSTRLTAFGAWLEQLIAESTGKQGKGLVVVDGEALGAPDSYGDDRLFVFVGLDEEAAEVGEPVRDRLVAAGHPIIDVRLESPLDLGQEMFRWEVATATVGHILGINPFDQPNVQESKDITKRLLSAFESSGALPQPEVVPLAEGEIVKITAPEVDAKAIGSGTVGEVLRRHLGRARVPDYIALNAFVPMTDGNAERLAELRDRIRGRGPMATTVGFGPRFLHSTGQLHKGGADRGVFLHLTASPTEDAEVPGWPYGFRTLFAAQDLGDFMALAEAGRRIIRVELGPDPAVGLRELVNALR